MRFQKLTPGTLVLSFVLLFASAEFFLLLRHKSPYVSDTYFYKHQVYIYSGKDFNQAHDAVISQLDFTKLDEIEKNFYFDRKAYTRSLSFISKRPLYPWMVLILNSILQNEYLSLLLPVFVSYFLVILTFYHLCRLDMPWFYASMAIASFISFYPYLDLSTYFLTDTIGTAFWLGLLLSIYRYFETDKKTWLLIYASLLAISLLNREQNVLFLVVMGIMWLLLRFQNKSFKKRFKSIHKILLVTTVVIGVFVIVSLVLGTRTLYDTIVYTQNQYGLLNNVYPLEKTLLFQLDRIIKSHIHLAKDLASRHWWAVFLLFGAGYATVLLLQRKMSLIDIMMFSSGLASYAAIFLYPILSYRYFFPVVASIIYFFIKMLIKFSGKEAQFVPESNEEYI